MTRANPPITPTTPAEPTGLDEQWWGGVVGAIPPEKAANAGLMLKVRGELEIALNGCLTMERAYSIRFAAGSRAREALRAHGQIKAALAYAEKTNNAPLIGSLCESLKIMITTTQVDGLISLQASRKGRNDPPRRWLCHAILKVWTDTLMAPLTTGRRNDASGGKRGANSPVIRFLIAVLSPRAPIGPEAAEKAVERERTERERLRREILARAR
jgi:hypothetical protein